MKIRIGSDINMKISLGEQYLKDVAKIQCILICNNYCCIHHNTCDMTDVLEQFRYPTSYNMCGNTGITYNCLPDDYMWEFFGPICSHELPKIAVINADIISNSTIRCTYPGKMQKMFGDYYLAIKIWYKSDVSVEISCGKIFTLVGRDYDKEGTVNITIYKKNQSDEDSEGSNTDLYNLVERVEKLENNESDEIDSISELKIFLDGYSNSENLKRILEESSNNNSWTVL